MGKTISRPEDVPPVGTVTYYETMDRGGHNKGRAWFIVVDRSTGFGSQKWLGGQPETWTLVFNDTQMCSTVGCVIADDPSEWPDEVCAAVAKWRLSHEWS